MSNIRVTVHRESSLSENWDLDEFVAYISQIADKVPVEHRAGAMVCIESEYDSTSVQMEVYYQRPPTKAEKDAERVKSAYYKQQCEDNERRQLAALKAKYEP